MKRSTKLKQAKLEIRPKGLRPRLSAFLEALRGDKRLMAAFLKNPAKILANRVVGSSPAREQTSEVNRLLFALISNDDMRTWLETYQGKRARLDKRAFASELAKQVAKLEDDNIIAALIVNATSGNGIPGLGDVAYTCVVRETASKDSCTCTPVARDNMPTRRGGITPDELRAVTEALVERGKELRKSGELANLDSRIG